MGKHPLRRKATFTWEKKTSTLPHTEDWCPEGGQRHPQVFKGPGPEKRMGFSAWGKTCIPVRNPMSTLALLLGGV